MKEVHFAHMPIQVSRENLAILAWLRAKNFLHQGCQIGTVLAMAFSGYLAELVNWESIFYVFGSCSVIWFFFWIFLVYDSPMVHPRITKVKFKTFFYCQIILSIILFYFIKLRKSKNILRQTFRLTMRARLCLDLPS